jgi:hypothetical protein
MKTTRIQFVQGAFGVGAAGLLLAACGGDDDDDGANNGAAGTSSGGGACGSTIATNHGHSVTVTKADAAAGAAKTYDIQGGADHSHTLEISAAQFAMLAAGDPVTIMSSTDAAHAHMVTVSCPP